MSKNRQPKKPVHFFYSGTHTDMHGQTLNFSDADLEDLASSYDPAISEAPFVFGHPDNDSPSEGWVTKIAVNNKGAFAFGKQLSEKLVSMVRNGRYKKISAAIYMPWSKGNPKPGHHYLKHIGFFGGAATALKDLQPAELGEDDKDVYTLVIDDSSIVQFSERGNTGMTDAEKAAALQAENDKLKAKLSAAQLKGDQAAAFAAQEQSIKDREAEIKKQEDDLKARALAFAAKEQNREREGIASFVASFIDKDNPDAGKLLPRHREPLTSIMLDMKNQQPLSFGEGQPAQDRQTWFKGFLREVLEQKDAQVNFSEEAGGDVATVHIHNSKKGLDMPDGSTPDPLMEKVHQQAVAYSQTHNVEYDAAVDIVAANLIKG